MEIFYTVSIKKDEKTDCFNITWLNKQNTDQDCFTSPPIDMYRDVPCSRWSQHDFQLAIGNQLFHFLDGDCHLQKALKDAHGKGKMLQLVLETDPEIQNWPFELLARDNSFLCLGRVNIIRMISEWGKERKKRPAKRPLKLLFMACSARDVLPELDYEREEDTITALADRFSIDIDIEDTGSLEGLALKLVKNKYDVIHLSGHTEINQNKNTPFFIMESPTGEREEISPDQLWNKALINHPPRLLFLSACSTGKSTGPGFRASLAQQLVENFHIPAVLGWGRSIADKLAIKAEKYLYHDLSRGQSILQAIERVRFELSEEERKIGTLPANEIPAWSQLRLFCNGTPLNALVNLKKERRPVTIKTRGFIGRRRQLQQSIRVLSEMTGKKTGIIILGSAGTGKSKLANKICDRFPDYTLIRVKGELTETSLATALKDGFIKSRDKEGLRHAIPKNLQDKIPDICSTSFQKKNYLLFLDDFDKNLAGAEVGKPGKLIVDAQVLLKALLKYLPNSGGMTKMMITSRYLFPLIENNQDLVETNLEKIWLPSFNDMEQHKKGRLLENIIKPENKELTGLMAQAGYGNPLLMEKLVNLALGLSESSAELVKAAIEKEKELFINDCHFRELYHARGDSLACLLKWLAIFRLPVQPDGVQMVAERAGIKEYNDVLKSGLALGLIEYDQTRETYQVIRLMREEWLTELVNTEDHSSCFQPAFDYYKKHGQEQHDYDPLLIEEWIYSALQCGEEETASEQGGYLVKYYRESLECNESERIGSWIIDNKDERKIILSTQADVFLLNETALTMKQLYEWGAAAHYYQCAMDIDRSLFGDNHPAVARDLNYLGETWRSLGDLDKSIDYFHEALKIVENNWSEKHSDLFATLLYNLGLYWFEKLENNKAIQYFSQALATWKEKYRTAHHTVASTLVNLGKAYIDFKELEKAGSCFAEAFSIDQQIYGDWHPVLSVDLIHIGTLASIKKDYKKAQGNFKDALVILNYFSEYDNPHVAEAWNGLAQVLIELGQPVEAIDYLNKALPIVEKVFGKNHLKVSAIYFNIGDANQAMGKFEQAIEFFNRALSIDRGFAGTNPPNLIRDLEKLGETTRTIGQNEKANDYFNEAYCLSLGFFGSEHEVTRSLKQRLN